MFGWTHTGERRPDFAIEPGPGEESVWDYPRPPRLDRDSREVVVRAGEVEIGRTRSAFRVLETASPPTFYLPPEDLALDALRRAGGGSHCEWKGAAAYWDVVTESGVLERSGWSYEDPSPRFAALAGHVAFYPARLACFVDGERVRPQPGGFYGGWVTREVVGPFKGEPGTGGW